MFKNRDFEIAFNHLQACISESEDSTKDILDILNGIIEKNKKNEELTADIKRAIEKLQYQDIFAQRLKKVQNFLKDVDKKVVSKKDEKELNDFAWEKEINQDDVDDILKSHGL